MSNENLNDIIIQICDTLMSYNFSKYNYVVQESCIIMSFKIKRHIIIHVIS